jgi:CMP-N-acetylneuraminic acid synthetase
LEILGIIPARGGSKSIGRKNLAVLLGRPLLTYTCEAARNSSLLTRVIISTDDEEMSSTAQASGIEAPFLRPSSLSEDSTPMIPVLQHALGALRPYSPDIVVLLQPTSPLRTSAHVDAAVRLLLESGADSVVTVVEVPHQFNPVSVMKMTDGHLTPYLDVPQILRRQDKPRVFARNGPAVLAAKRSVIDAGSLYGTQVVALEMKPAESIDIDEAGDLALAEFWLRQRNRS